MSTTCETWVSYSDSWWIMCSSIEQKSLHSEKLCWRTGIVVSSVLGRWDETYKCVRRVASHIMMSWPGACGGAVRVLFCSVFIACLSSYITDNQQYEGGVPIACYKYRNQWVSCLSDCKKISKNEISLHVQFVRWSAVSGQLVFMPIPQPCRMILIR